MSSLVPTLVPYEADELSSAELDALPYGMIQLDSRGMILRYSAAEARLGGVSAAAASGAGPRPPPCRMIQLDSRGMILRYSAAESRLSGLSAAECIGRHFFRDVA